MPEKSRQRRVKIAKRQGKSTAVKSSDVGLAKGLSRHAAKKSRHVEGMRTLPDRKVSRKRPPVRSRTKVPTEVEMLSLDAPELRIPSGGRVPGMEKQRSKQKVISRRTPSLLAAKSGRKK